MKERKCYKIDLCNGDFAPLVPPIGKTLAAKNISITSPARLADYRVGWTKN